MAPQKGKWTENAMKEAIKRVLYKELSLRDAAFHFSVPKSTLADRVKNLRDGKEIVLTANMGRFKKTFSSELESQIVAYLKDLDNSMMPMSRKEFLKFVYDLAEHLRIPHQFNKNKQTAGKKFYYQFMSHHPEFSLRCPQSTSIQRATGFNKEQVDLFFTKYEALLSKYNFPASKIFNCDETGISIVHENSRKVLSLKGKKQVSKITSGERGKNITILLSINASGDQFLPPLFVFPRKKMIEELKKDGPEGSCFIAEESGWINASGFLTWLKMFNSRVNPTEASPALIVLDGHSSHKDLQVILYAKEHHIHMISLPPHTTHKLQPLDRAIMKPFKAAYNEACAQWMKRYCPLKITMRDVAGLVNTAFTSICRMELAQSAFRCTGLFPLKKDIFSDLDFLAAAHFTPPTEAVEGIRQPNSPIAGPSAAVTPQFQKLIEQISPTPQETRKKIVMRKRRTEKSEILTSTPYKTMLEEKARLNEEKKEEKAAKIQAKRNQEKTIFKAVETSSKIRVKRVLDLESGVIKKQAVISKENDTECIICGESFNEDWVQCMACKGWAHVACTPQENIDYFKCDCCVR